MANKPGDVRTRRGLALLLGAGLGAAALWCLTPPAAQARDAAEPGGQGVEPRGQAGHKRGHQCGHQSGPPARPSVRLAPPGPS
ncbi:hypothetical protein [Cupriavidus sp. H18C1]|uniref:hypothetical protein n=1 Tax=Cupriavidus sp. H18C1 TaxID=3241601 RepID=UPI003BB97CE9